MQRQFISFPKSGRTWIRYILAQLGVEQDILFHHDDFEFNDGSLPAHNFDVDSRRKKYAQVDRIVYLQRDPRDVIVSLYHQVTGRFRDFFNYNDSLPRFIRHDYFGAHVLKRFRRMWEELSRMPNVLVVHYEDCQQDMPAQIKRILQFYGYPVDQARIEAAVANATLEKMRKVEKNREFPQPWLQPRNDSLKVRRGKVGGFRDELEPRDIAWLNALFDLNDQSRTAQQVGKRILLAWFTYTINGGLGRFIHCARVLEKEGHRLDFVSLDNSLQTDWPGLQGKILSFEEAGCQTWDAVMVPGAGLSDDQLPLLEKLQDERFGTRVQHILNDSSLEERFLKVNKALNPHVVIFNNSHWQSYVNLAGDRFYILPGAVDTKIHFPQKGRPIPRNKNKWRIGGYGRKNADPLISALRLLPKKYELHLYGLENYSSEDADQLKKEGRLKFHGNLFDQQLADFYNQMDMVVTTETVAGWCNTAAQAMAHGLPTIVSQAGTIDFAEDKFNCLVLDEVSPKKIAARIKKLSSDGKLCERLARNAAEKMRFFSWESYCRQLLNFIEKPDWPHYYRDVTLGLFGKRPFSDRIAGLDFLTDKMAGHTVLDVGAAEGLVSVWLARQAGIKQADAFEFDAGRVAFGRSLIQSNNIANVRLGRADLSSWSQFVRDAGSGLNENYDTVLFLGLYHHLPARQRKEVLVRLSRMAAKWFVIRTPRNFFEGEGLDNLIRREGFRPVHRQDQQVDNEAGTLCIYEKIAEHVPGDEETIVVLGMHRSGTSMVTNIVSRAGYYVGPEEDLMPACADNGKGYFERASVAAANDRILELAGGSWDNPPQLEDIYGIRIDPFLKPLLDDYAGFERRVIKDPRLCLTFPVWRHLLGKKVKLVWVTREADAVVKSLRKRGMEDENQLHRLYQIYNRSVENFVDQYDCLRLRYEDFFNDQFRDTVARMKEFLRADEDFDELVREVVDASLNHHSRDDEGLRHRLAEALKALEKGQPEESARIYAEVLEGAPENPEALFGCGLACRILNQNEQAAELFERLIAVQPDYAAAHNQLAELALMNTQIPRAVVHLRKSLKLDAGQIPVKNKLIDAHLLNGQFDEAVNLLHRTLDDHPDDVDTLIHAGEIYLRAGKAEQSAVYFNRALELDPQNKAAGRMLENLSALTEEN